MLTVSENEEDLFAAVRAGAIGYLLKEVVDRGDRRKRSARSRAGRLDLAVDDDKAARREFNALSRRVEEQHATRRDSRERELEVLRLVARGMSNKEIAAELVIAENTVRNHVRNILEKLQLRSRMEAAMYAVRERLVDAT